MSLLFLYVTPFVSLCYSLDGISDRHLVMEHLSFIWPFPFLVITAKSVLVASNHVSIIAPEGVERVELVLLVLVQQLIIVVIIIRRWRMLLVLHRRAIASLFGHSAHR